VELIDIASQRWPPSLFDEQSAHHEAVMAGFETRGKRDPTNFRRRQSDRRFVLGVVIGAIGLIVLSIALGVGISPEVSMFAAP
jgi:hypothetical protein